MVYTLRFLSLQNAVCFIILTYLVPVLFTFYIQGVLKLKKNNSGAERLTPTIVTTTQSFDNRSVKVWSPRSYEMLLNIVSFLQRVVVSKSLNSHARVPPLVGCPRVLIQHIRSYPPYLEAVHSHHEDTLCCGDGNLIEVTNPLKWRKSSNICEHPQRIKIAVMSKLRADWGRAMVAIIRCCMFCLPVCYPKI